MEQTKKDAIRQLMVTYGEVERMFDNLEKIKEHVEKGEKDNAIDTIDNTIEWVGDDLQYMELFAGSYPLEEMRDITKKCLEEKKIPFMNNEGIFVTDYEKFIKQGVDGMMYDLNRDYATIYTLYGQRTMNDLGMVILVTHLLNERNELKKELDELKSKESDNETL